MAHANGFFLQPMSIDAIGREELETLRHRADEHPTGITNVLWD